MENAKPSSKYSLVIYLGKLPGRYPKGYLLEGFYDIPKRTRCWGGTRGARV